MTQPKPKNALMILRAGRLVYCKHIELGYIVLSLNYFSSFMQFRSILNVFLLQKQLWIWAQYIST